jgi:hypothetical protein
MIYSTGSKIIIRPEEGFIVVLVLLLWIGAIGLFIHRWGKIRMLEPYIPKFEQESHRPSCVLSNLETITTAKRMSLGLSQLTALQINGGSVGPSWNPHQIGVGRGIITLTFF